ncbi:MAG: hypothetical protein H7211_03960 [Aquabacterium sp.]|nr:hypothetical protein [Ferruginibacter sp.]
MIKICSSLKIWALVVMADEVAALDDDAFYALDVVAAAGALNARTDAFCALDVCAFFAG